MGPEKEVMKTLKSQICSGYTWEHPKRFEGTFPIDPPVTFHGGFEKWQPYSSVMELYLRDARDVKYRNEIEDFVGKAREAGMEIIMHLPFLHSLNTSETPEAEKQFNFELRWLTVPKGYNGFKAKEMTLESLIKCVDIASDLGIKYLTMHVTSAKCSLNDDEFLDYKGKLARVVDAAKATDTQISVETGGITENQLTELVRDLDVTITYDVAHAYLDGFDVLGFYKKNKDKIKVVHLSQTEEGADRHWELYKNGVLNQYMDFIIRDISKDYTKGDETRFVRYVILETTPDFKNQEYLHEVLNGKGI